MEVLQRVITNSEIALAAAEPKVSPYTGFYHFNERDESREDTIPIFLNFCYALALFKSKQKEKMEKAKDLIDRLLFFQSVDGNFPIHLHDYPKATQFIHALKILTAFLPILKHFSAVLESERKKRWEDAAQKCLAYLLDKKERLSSTKQIYVEILCAFWKDYAYHPEKLWEVCEGFSSDEWGELLVYVSLLPEKTAFLQKARSFYREDLGFLGSYHSEYRVKGIDQPSLLEVAFQDPKKLFGKTHPVYVQAGLLDAFEEVHRIQEVQAGKYSLREGENSAFIYLPLSEARPHHKGEHTFRLLFQDADLVMQDFKNRVIIEENRILIILPEDVPQDDVEITLHHSLREKPLLVNGVSGSTFHLGEELDLGKMRLNFKLLEGEGTFFGHFLRGNRFAEKTKDPYAAFDEIIALRTVRRAGSCTILLEFTEQE